MKNILAVITVLALICSCAAAQADANTPASAEAKLIYVAPNGDDTRSEGAYQAPLATLGAALRMAKDILAAGGAAEIVLRGGDYFISETIALDESFSGAEGAPFVIRAFEGERVRLIGGVKVDGSRVSPVTDESILSRVIDKTAAAKLMALDLSGVAGDMPLVYARHFAGTSEAEPRVFIGDNNLQYARWPNDDVGSAYLYTGEVSAAEDGLIQFDYVDATDRANKYWSSESVNNMRVLGYLSYEWVNNLLSVSAYDFETKTLKTYGGLSYPPTPGSHRFFFYNLLEEIDRPWECFDDRENKIIYFYPGDEIGADIYVSTLTGPIITLNKTSHIAIEGICFAYTRGNALTANDVSDLKLLNCTVAHTSSNAFTLTGNRITVDGCHIYDTMSGGISITGGDKRTLASAQSVIQNCEIHDINQNGRTHRYGIMADSLGLLIKNNLMYNCVHGMILINTNDVVLEYNEFHHCVTESADMGAVYFGRDPSMLGIVIRYNYFHDIGNPYDSGVNGQQSIFIDDASMGAHIYGNVFYRGTVDSAAIKTNGAQFSRIENNIFADMPTAMHHMEHSNENNAQATSWWLFLYDKSSRGDHDVWDRLVNADFESDIWRDHYQGTQWSVLWDYADTQMYDLLCSPEYDGNTEAMEALARAHAPSKTNVLRNNLAYQIVKGSKYNGAIYQGGAVDYANNIRLDSEAIFAAYGTDFSLTDEALANIRAKIPSFENIPMDKIGPHNND